VRQKKQGEGRGLAVVSGSGGVVVDDNDGELLVEIRVVAMVTHGVMVITALGSSVHPRLSHFHHHHHQKPTLAASFTYVCL